MRDYQRRIAALLHYCQQQLSIAVNMPPEQRRGPLEAAVMHLHTAYRSYVVEVVSAYHISEQSLPAAWQLSDVIEQLLQGQHQSGELNEMITLAEQGWLNQLLALYQRSQLLEQPVSVSRPASAGQFTIAAVNIEAAELDFELDTVLAIKQQFADLIQRQRQHAIES
jgi:hypothetical protein